MYNFPGPPDPPSNCSVVNQTTESLEVECLAGFDGGLRQNFYMKVEDSITGTVLANASAEQKPIFQVKLTSSSSVFANFPSNIYPGDRKGRFSSPERNWKRRKKRTFFSPLFIPKTFYQDIKFTVKKANSILTTRGLKVRTYIFRRIAPNFTRHEIVANNATQ